VVYLVDVCESFGAGSLGLSCIKVHYCCCVVTVDMETVVLVTLLSHFGFGHAIHLNHRIFVALRQFECLVSHSPITCLSVINHVRDIISRCAQSLHALKIMRCYGMNSDALKTVYKLVVLAKLLYASPA